MEQLHGVLSRHVESGAVPGLVGLVARGPDVHVEAVGSRWVGGPNVARDTIFRIASMTKPVVAVAAMTLVEECRLRLDDPLDAWLPELADRRVLVRIEGPLDETVPADRPITLRDLLTFRFGFGQILADPAEFPILAAATEANIGMGPPDPAGLPDPDEWMRRLGSLPLMHQPGTRWLYHTGADVLGVLLSRVCGEPLEAVLRDRVFDPLGMVDTGFHCRSLDRFTVVYTGDLHEFDPLDGAWSLPPAFPAGGAGLVSTVDDFAAFARMLLEGGSPVLSRSSVEVMTTDHLTPDQKVLPHWIPEQFAASGWGFGLAVVTRRIEGPSPVGTYGWDGGLGTTWRTDPSTGVVTILLTNAAFTSPRLPAVLQDFRTAAYAELRG